MSVDPADFIRANTIATAPPLVPEVVLHLATEVVPLWRKTEEELEASGVPPPYWAFAWAGGQALARYVLDNPEFVRARRVLDFGSGSGLLSIAAAKAGARDVLAADIDRFACAAIALNCEANFPPPHFAGEVSSERSESDGGGKWVPPLPPSVLRRFAPQDTSPALRGRSHIVEITSADVIGSSCKWDTILVGDMCYERPLAERLLSWLHACIDAGATVLLGDPGRSYFPKSGVTKLRTYHVQTTRELEDREIRETSVYRLTRDGAGPT
jgi:predicted nicotinamide N-methyase